MGAGRNQRGQRFARGGQALVQRPSMNADGLVQARLRLFQPSSQAIGVLAYRLDHFGTGGVEGIFQRGMVAFQLAAHFAARAGKQGMGGLGALRHDLRQTIPGRRQIFIQRTAMDGHRLVHPVASLGQPGGQAIAARGNVGGDTLAGFVQLLHHMVAARPKIDQQGLAGAFQALVDIAHLTGQRRHHILAGIGEMLRHFAAGLGKAADNIIAAHRYLRDEMVPGLTQNRRNFISLRTKGLGDAVTRRRHFLRNPHRSASHLLRQRFLRGGDGGAHPVGIADYGFALARQLVNQGADAALVVAVGALQIGDFRMHQCFQLAGAGQRPLNAIAHRRHFAADGLAEGDNLFSCHGFRLGEAHGHMCHRPRCQPHFLRAAQQRCGDEEENHRCERRN